MRVHRKPIPPRRRNPTDVDSLAKIPSISNSAHAKSIALIQFLAQVLARAHAAEHVYVVGGAVRDFVLGHPIKDVDICVDSVALGRDSAWIAARIADAIPARTSLDTNQYGVAILTISGPFDLDGRSMQGEVIEIANARSESYGAAGKGYKPDKVEPATIQADVYRREFTFNTLLWRFSDLANGPEFAPIIDLTGKGLADLHAGVIRCPSDPDKTFQDDPTRIVRYIKFFCRYNFTLTPETERALRRNVQAIKNAPHNAISEILIKNVLQPKVARKALTEMQRVGLLAVVYEWMAENKAFRAALQNWVDPREAVAATPTTPFKPAQPVSLMLTLADFDWPVASKMSFMVPVDQARFREVVSRMSDASAFDYLCSLKQPGRVVDTVSLIAQFGLKGAEIARLNHAAVNVLLADPSLCARGAEATSATASVMSGVRQNPRPLAVMPRADLSAIRSRAWAECGGDRSKYESLVKRYTRTSP